PRLLHTNLSTFFFSISSFPPSPTLLPYTMLFRSYFWEYDRRPGFFRTTFRSGYQYILQSKFGGDQSGDPKNRTGSFPLIVRIQQDRKSTRLNSSHVKISYAVFCLKKKTTPTQ